MVFSEKGFDDFYIFTNFITTRSIIWFLPGAPNYRSLPLHFIKSHTQNSVQGNKSMIQYPQELNHEFGPPDQILCSITPLNFRVCSSQRYAEGWGESRGEGRCDQICLWQITCFRALKFGSERIGEKENRGEISLEYKEIVSDPFISELECRRSEITLFFTSIFSLHFLLMTFHLLYVEHSLKIFHIHPLLSLYIVIHFD